MAENKKCNKLTALTSLTLKVTEPEFQSSQAEREQITNKRSICPVNSLALFSIISMIEGSLGTYLSRPMMKALSLMQWLVSWGHSLILETRL